MPLEIMLVDLSPLLSGFFDLERGLVGSQLCRLAGLRLSALVFLALQSPQPFDLQALKLYTLNPKP